MTEEQAVDISKHQYFIDLCEYYPTIHPSILFERMKYANIELAYKWHALLGTMKLTKKFLNLFYSTDLYTFDLVRYQISREHSGETYHQLKQILNLDLNKPKILDFGGGCGHWSYEISKKLKVSYYDLPGASQSYAISMFNKHKSSVTVISDPFYRKWDIINVSDVLEHIPEKECNKIIDQIHASTSFVFCEIDIPFNPLYPMHIYDFTPYFLTKFKLVSGKLYKKI